jgi:copper chaperone CopZ
MNTNISLPLIDVNSAHCALRVENAIKTVPALAESNVDLERHIANLSSTATAQNVRDAVTAIREAGYNVATDTRTFDTTGISCGGCVNSVTKILNGLPGVLALSVDVSGRTATVEVVHGSVPYEELTTALKPTGYRLSPQAA